MSEFTFTDTEGIKWDLKLNLGIAKFIDTGDYGAVTRLKFSFLQPTKEFFGEVFSNIQFAMALAWTIVQPQVPGNYGIEPGAADEDESLLSKLELRFVQAMDGDVLQEAKNALISSIADFFPEQRTVLSTLQNKIEKAKKLMELELSSLDVDMDKWLEQEVREKTSEALDQLRGESSIMPPEPLDGDQETLRNLLSGSSS